MGKHAGMEIAGVSPTSSEPIPAFAGGELRAT